MILNPLQTPIGDGEVVAVGFVLWPEAFSTYAQSAMMNGSTHKCGTVPELRVNVVGTEVNVVECEVQVEVLASYRPPN